jgi:hypothetical protein
LIPLHYVFCGTFFNLGANDANMDVYRVCTGGMYICMTRGAEHHTGFAGFRQDSAYLSVTVVSLLPHFHYGGENPTDCSVCFVTCFEQDVQTLKGATCKRVTDNHLPRQNIN